VLAVRGGREYFVPIAHHDALPERLPFERSGGLFGEPAPNPLVPYPILPPSPAELEVEEGVVVAVEGERAG
jgi:hypothetical protein